MKTISILAALLILAGYPISAQDKIPVIKASSGIVAIRDSKNAGTSKWYITPSLRPDIYKTSGKHNKVTFHTDTDSISFKVRPGKTYDFVILLNGRDSAFTRVKYEPAAHVPGPLDILKKGGKYDYSDKRELLKFTYKPEQDPELMKLRNKFKLDSVAGGGNELSKIFRLLHWVHNSFVYDGTKELPEYVGTCDLMTKCINGRGTMHCGAMAWALNNCYLAMGFKARHVVCLPKDSADYDCHSINAVYLKALNKWLWMDPTNDAYVMNEKGELLSIAEVRERLISNKPLILNPEANLNRIYPVEKENYLYDYMAKNLYAFQCYVDGGGESRSNLLLPAEYKGVIPRTKMNKPKCTSNPAVFWAKPD